MDARTEMRLLSAMHRTGRARPLDLYREMFGLPDGAGLITALAGMSSGDVLANNTTLLGCVDELVGAGLAEVWNDPIRGTSYNITPAGTDRLISLGFKEYPSLWDRLSEEDPEHP